MTREEVERRIVVQRLDPILAGEAGWVMPRYEGLSIANLPATVAGLFGVELPGALPPLPGELTAGWGAGLRRVVLVVLDGLGYRLLEERWGAGEGQALKRLARAGQLWPVTSVFPSTTDAALVSLMTGRPPAEHGWLAYEMYLREYGLAANAILLCPVWARTFDTLLDWGLDPETMVPLPTVAEALAEAGVATAGVLAAHLAGSGFTRMLYRGVGEIRGHRHGSDLWVQLREMLAATRGQRAFLTAYWGGLDTIGHAYGRNTVMWEAEFRSVCHLLEREFVDRVPEEDREGTLLLITADHGMIDVPPEHVVIAHDDPELRRHMQVPVTGESRAAFLFPRPGRGAAVRSYLEGAFNGQFWVVESCAALEAGLMGRPVADETVARAGELLVLPRGDHALQRAQSDTALRGRHGGLTAEEMLVPLFAVRLESCPRISGTD